MASPDALDAAIEAHPARPTLCGALRISRDGQVLLERAYGRASGPLGVPNTPRTRFHIASATKMFIAAATLRLAADGRVSLRAHPSAYVPELAALHPDITLHHLLTHTAGLADVYDVPSLRLDVAGLVHRQGRLLDYLTALAPLQPPGVGWRYSSTGFLFLAYVVEAAAGAPFADVVGDLFLKPLGLADTGPDDPSRINPGRAMGHLATSDGWRNAPNDRLAEIDAPREFYSTVGDLDRWTTALHAGDVLGPDALAQTFTRHAEIGPDAGFAVFQGCGYGYGWFLGDGFRWVGGMTPGFRAMLWRYPDERLNVVMLWNTDGVHSQALMAALRAALSRSA